MKSFFKVGHYYKHLQESRIWLWLKVENDAREGVKALLLNSEGTIVKYWYEESYNMYWEEIK